MELFASESDRMDYERERATDPMEEYRAVLRAEHFDYFADEQPYTCTEHGYEDYEGPCPQVHAPVEAPAQVADPDYPEPPF